MGASASSLKLHDTSRQYTPIPIDGWRRVPIRANVSPARNSAGETHKLPAVGTNPEHAFDPVQVNDHGDALALRIRLSVRVAPGRLDTPNFRQPSTGHKHEGGLLHPQEYGDLE